MYDAVEIVALPTDQLVESRAEGGRKPGIVGDFGVCVVGADLVDGQKDENERVGNPGERKFFCRKKQDKQKDDDKDILQGPIFPVIRINAQVNKLNAKQARQKK
jgi:hypothetical protein